MDNMFKPSWQPGAHSCDIDGGGRAHPRTSRGAYVVNWSRVIKLSLLFVKYLEGLVAVCPRLEGGSPTSTLEYVGRTNPTSPLGLRGITLCVSLSTPSPYPVP
eukprot:1678920-Pyramimonas_sp.AAC.1